MKILWSDQAIYDLDSIINYIAQDNLNAAVETAERLLEAIENLIVETPFIGRPGRVEGTREYTTIAPYIIVYQVNGEQIEIITIRHGARLWPDSF